MTSPDCYLFSGWLVRGHVTLQLRAVAEGVGAQWAGEALLVLLVAILDVFFQRCQTLVAALAVRTGEHLGKGVRCAGQQVWTRQEVMSQTVQRSGSHITYRSLSPAPLTVLALVLSDGLRCAQSRHLLRGFWVNDGGVTALQVFCDGCRVTVAIFQLTFQEVLIELGDAAGTFH